MTVHPEPITAEVARGILAEAERNGVSVDRFLNDIAHNATRHNVPLAVRRVAEKVDLGDSRKWLEENAGKYRGQWVVLDGDHLIGAGADPVPIVKRARAQGVKVPFAHFVREPSEPFMGGWL